MGKNAMRIGRNIILAAAIFGIIFIAGCVAEGQKGTLQGHVIIGPLCPVEPCNVTQEQIENAYASRKILIYDAGRQTILEEADIGKDGNYRIELNPGNYVVDIARAGIGGSKDLPRNIKIDAGKTITLNTDIDTGIR